MRLVLQRVSQARVTIKGALEGIITNGLCILVGIEESDDENDLDWLSQKVLSMRIFDDGEGKMNLSVQDIKGDLLVVSQFTLHASTKKGNRPSFIRAARPEKAVALYEKLVAKFRQSGLKTETGVFGGDMAVSLTNDGPVTIILDSKQRE